MSWRCLGDKSRRRLGDMFWRRLEDMSWIHLQDVLEIKKMEISVTCKSKCVCVYLTSLYFTNPYLMNPKRIQNPYLKPNNFNNRLFWNSSSISILRIKISVDCLVLWNQLNSNSTLQNRWGNKSEILPNILDIYIYA